ncbi:MAG: (E)-4-hydroxy-3-methylbut-2-enyl-diphosphate synthase [Bacteroidota bacterium]
MRFPAKEVFIGNIPVGGKNPCRIQSMTNTRTADVQATIAQSIRIFDAGADFVRISVPSMNNIEDLKEIKNGLRKAGYNNPLIADVHFNPQIALEAARVVEKVRINPGNYTDNPSKNKTFWTEEDSNCEIEKLERNLLPLINVCKENSTAIRIGTNFGSLSKRIISKYGHTPEAMVEATMEFLRIFSKHSFDKIVISLKASNPLINVQAYTLMASRMLEEKMYYPFHVGVTEAGLGENGRMKSALGIGSLLKQGIGDTIRVSLSEPPENEIPVARKIAEYFKGDFKKNNEDADYSVKKLDLMQNNFLLPGNKKVVFVSNAMEIEDTKAKEELKPDLIYIEELNNNQHKKSESADYFLTPSKEYFRTNMPSNVIPLFDSLPENEAKYESEFNVLKCSSLDEIERIKRSIPGLILLLEMTNEKSHEGIEDHLLDNKIDFPIIVKKKYNNSIEDFAINVALDFGSLLLQKKIQGLWIENSNLSKTKIAETVLNLYQAAGLRISKTEFVSCPTCSRTSFDLEKLLQQLQKSMSHLPGLKIAVMGCIVNGPGEMADADYGFIGTGAGKVHIYKGSNVMLKNINPDDAGEELIKILKKEGRYKD